MIVRVALGVLIGLLLFVAVLRALDAGMGADRPPLRNVEEPSGECVGKTTGVRYPC